MAQCLKGNPGLMLARGNAPRPSLKACEPARTFRSQKLWCGLDTVGNTSLSFCEAPQGALHVAGHHGRISVASLFQSTVPLRVKPRFHPQKHRPDLGSDLQGSMDTWHTFKFLCTVPDILLSTPRRDFPAQIPCSFPCQKRWPPTHKML